MKPFDSLVLSALVLGTAIGVLALLARVILPVLHSVTAALSSLPE